MSFSGASLQQSIRDESFSAANIGSGLQTRLIVDETPYDDDFVAILNTATKGALELPDNIVVIGKMSRKTVLICIGLEDVGENKIQMSSVARNNICVDLGNLCRVQRCDIQPGKFVRISPYESSINERRPVHRGNTLFIYVKTRLVKFKVINTDPAEFCTVTPDTIIKTEPAKHENLVGYDDIGGYKKQINQLRELVELPLRHPQAFETIGIKPPRGILISGPPGTGKTLMARAVINETIAFSCPANGREIMNGIVGMSENSMQEVFKEAEHKFPAIIFIDEIDNIAPKREKMQGSVEQSGATELLALMDGLQARYGVVVVATTNRLNSIDPALRRYGRFDREVDIGIPDFKGRLEILKIHAKNFTELMDDDLEQIAADTHGYVGSDLASLCLEAAMQKMREKRLLEVDEVTVDTKVLSSLKVTMENFRSALRVSKPSVLRETVVEVPEIAWEDIGGLEDVKMELKETVQNSLEYPEKFSDYGMSPSMGVLLYGPPGTGKTLLAKAVANKCKANFISIKGPELLTMWFGESEAKVREVFDKARAAAPCVIFFDEVDSIAKVRGSLVGDAGGAGDRVLNQILSEMDGITTRKNVLIIGATNRPDAIDPALLRPGRLDQLLYIPLPDSQSRLSILRATLRKSALSPSVDLQLIAQETDGFSGADLAEICRRAVKLAIRESTSMDKATFEGDTIMNNTEKNKLVPTLTNVHFDGAMKYARRSVSDKDIEKYRVFEQSQKLPSYGSYQGN